MLTDITDIRVNPESDAGHGINPSARLAVLIDAENVSVDLWPRIYRLLELLGKPAVIRAYTCAKPGKWGSISGIEVIDGGKDVTGPNAADFLLAFDAGRLCASNETDRFVIVSGDDGFAPLIKALQLSGKATSIVVPTCGSIGDRKSVRVADVTMLVPQARMAMPCEGAPQGAAKSINGGADDRKDCLSDDEKTILRDTVEYLGRSSDGWATIAQIGNELLGKRAMKLPGKLSTLLASLDFLEIRDPKTAKWSVRVRRASP
jgi:hypothetical protein